MSDEEEYSEEEAEAGTAAEVKKSEGKTESETLKPLPVPKPEPKENESESESEPEPEIRKTQPEPKEEKKAEEAEFIKRQEQKRSDFDEQLKEYIQEWRKQRAKEEDDLVKLKEKQGKRKTLRDQQEKLLGEKKRQEEERVKREAEEKKQREIEAKLRRLEEAERKRQLMLQAQKASLHGKNNFLINKSESRFEEPGSSRLELLKTKEQLEEEKKISLSFRVKSLDLSGLSADALRKKAAELWTQLIRLETEKYDLEERQKRQDYDLKELKERQKQQLRHKALKRGLDPEALTGKYPPKLQVASKYERRVDTRSYDEKKKLYDGGLDDINKETTEKNWAEMIKSFDERQKSKLPKWFGERPGKKKGDADSPEEEPVNETTNVDIMEVPTYEGEEEEAEAAESAPQPEDEEEEEEEEEDEEE